MNDILKAIHGRRSVRAFTEQAVSKDDLKTIVEAGRMAPNAWNSQSYTLTVVTNPEYLHRLAEVTANHLEGELCDHNFFGAKQIIIMSDKRESFSKYADAGCILENIFLAAYSLGIGSVWINQFSTISDCPDVLALLDELQIGRDEIICGIAALGYPASSPEPKPRMSTVRYFE